jgi:hypothetical protein
VSMDIASFRSQRESELGGLTPDTSLIDAEILLDLRNQQSGCTSLDPAVVMAISKFFATISNRQISRRTDRRPVFGTPTKKPKLLAIVSIYSCRSESRGLPRAWVHSIARASLKPPVKVWACARRDRFRANKISPKLE